MAVRLQHFLTFFIWKTRNYGGWCVGMRWYVPIMPLLLLYFGLWIDRVRITRLLWALIILAFGVSCFHVQDALSSPFQYSVWHNWLENAPNRGRVGKTFNLPKRRSKSKQKAKPQPQAAPAPSEQAPSAPAPSAPAPSQPQPEAGPRPSP